MTWLSQLAAGLWVVALPVFLMTLNGSLAVNQPRLYYYGFDAFHISQRTGIEPQALREIARALIEYFNSPQDYIQITVEIRGQERPLFTQREVIHLRDVKGLIRRVYWVAGLSLAYLVGYAGLWIARRRRAGIRELLRLPVWGAVLTLGLLLVLGLWAIVGFSGLFYLFHLVSFSNPFWMLDPRQHYLIQIFPQGFFYRATLFIAAATAAEAILLGGLAALIRARGRAASG